MLGPYRLTLMIVLQQVEGVLRREIDRVGGEPVSSAAVGYVSVLAVDALWDLT